MKSVSSFGWNGNFKVRETKDQIVLLSFIFVGLKNISFNVTPASSKIGVIRGSQICAEEVNFEGAENKA